MINLSVVLQTTVLEPIRFPFEKEERGKTKYLLNIFFQAMCLVIYMCFLFKSHDKLPGNNCYLISEAIKGSEKLSFSRSQS